MALVFVTSNENKWREAERILGSSLERVDLDLPELQATTTGEVAKQKAAAAYARLSRPVVVEDTGLEIAALGGFPGPFVKYWEKLGGLESICRAADGLGDRRLTAVCALAVCTSDGTQLFEGRAHGTIAGAPRGTNGFGWDVLFVPEGHTRTFAEMSADEKDRISHRRLAWEALSRTLRAGRTPT